MANNLLDAITSPLTGEYRKKKPLSVKAADTALSMTPVGTALEVGEELSSDEPSWLNIGLAVAPDVLGLGPVADPLMKAIKGTKFKTAKGSTYEVKDNNTTVRDKAARPEHPGESGVQPQSVKTIYMPRSELEKFAGVHQNPDMPTEFIPTGPDTAALRLTEDWGPRKAGEILQGTEVKFTLEPEVGLNPVEILDFRSPRGIHFVNEIVEVESNIPKVPPKSNNTRQVSNVVYDERVSALDSAEDAKTWQTNAEALVKDMRETSPTIRTPELEESAQALRDGKITREQHLKNINTYKPVESWDALPREPSNKATVFSLKPDQREKGRFILPADTTEALGVTQSGLKVGDRFNGRLDIPAYQRFDTWIVAGTSNAEKGVTHYAKAIHYKGVGDNPVRFAASQKTGEKIGTGEMGKTGYATVSGEIKDLDADAIRKKAEALLNDPEWTQVGFDPRRQSSFYVRGADNRHVPVREADEVIQIGPLVLAKNAKLDKDYAGYAEGGVAMDEQMKAVFKSRRGYALGGDVEIDPVSGNEVPPGSLPEEVRDDIPAMLSEGEYVVPADVLRFYGVKFFEDLRTQAKIGLAEMEANGRIGGEPIEEETGDVGISDEDLMVIMAQAPQEEQQVMANRGGLMGFQTGGLNYPAYIKQPDLTQFGMAGPDFQGGLEYRTFTNDAGMTITIPFFNGEPMGMIPPGYTEGEAPAAEEAAPERKDDDEPVRVPTPVQDTFDLDAIPTEKLEETARGMSTMTNIASGIASMAGLPVAALVNTAGVARYNDVLDRLKAEDPIAFEKSGLEKKGSIFGGESSLYENLADSDGDGKKSFGDTWLGDFLGFDGEAGIAEGNPGLRDSIGGARRTGDGGTAASTPSSNKDDGPSPAPTPTVIPTGATLATGTVLNDPDDPVVSTIDDSGKEVLKNESSLTEGQKAAMDWDE